MEEKKEPVQESFKLMFKGFFAIFKKQWWLIIVNLLSLSVATFFGFFFAPLYRHNQMKLFGISLGVFLLFIIICLILNHFLVSDAFSKDPDINEYGSRVLYMIMYAILISIIMSVAFIFIEKNPENAPYLKPGFVSGCSLIGFYCLFVIETLFDQKIFKKRVKKE